LRAPVRGLAWGVTVETAAFGYFLVSAFGGIGFSVYTQLRTPVGVARRLDPACCRSARHLPRAHRRRLVQHPELFVAAFAATIVAFTVFSKVFSQQYMTWLVPFVPLVRGLVASVLLIACLAMTQIEPHGFNHLHIATWLVFMLLARNVLLLVVLAQVAAAAREPRTASPAGRAQPVV
jgi:hypothetical protein